jgi:acyl phosphate:glycerol-3-phosphate acyltransferase
MTALPYLTAFTPPLLIGYLLGSIPFGLVITKLAGLGDIRDIGSGNIGATNVLRTGRKDLALATLILDAGKAGLAFFVCAVGMGWFYGNYAPGTEPAAFFSMGLVGGASAFIGHCFPVWLGLKGGKGVATFIGFLLAAMWQAGLAFGVTWLVVAGVFRMSSLAALVATVVAPAVVWYFGYGEFATVITAALAVLIFWRHRTNISRILAGGEPKIGAKKTAEAPPGNPG